MSTDRFRRRLFFALCGLVLVVDTLFFTVLTPLLPYYADRFGMSPGEVGLLAGAYAAGGAFSAIPAGLAATRLGVKPSLLCGLAIMVATSAIFGLAESGLELILIRFAQGIGSTVSWVAAFAWLLELVSPARRGETIGHGYGISMVGSLLGPALAPLIPEIGPESAFLVVSGLYAGLLLAFIRFPGPAVVPVELWAGLRLLVRLPGVRLGFWLLALQAVLFGALSVLGPLHLAGLGVGVLAISVVYLLTGGLAIGISPLAGRWSDRRGRLEPMRYSVAVGVAGLAVLPLFPGAWGYSVALISVSLVLFLLSAPASALVTDAVEARGLGFALGWAVVLLGWGPGSMVGAVGAGWLIETSAEIVPYLAMSVFCALALVVLLREKAARTIGGIAGGHPPVAG